MMLLVNYKYSTQLYASDGNIILENFRNFVMFFLLE